MRRCGKKALSLFLSLVLALGLLPAAALPAEASAAEGLTFQNQSPGSLTGAAQSAQQGLTAPGIEGFDFTLFAADNTMDCGIKIEDVPKIGRSLIGYSAQGKVPLTAMKVVSSDGKPFLLSSVSAFLDGYTGTATVRLSGYRNGALVETSAISSVKSVGNSGGAVVFNNTGKPGFMGIDSFTISAEGASPAAIGLLGFTAAPNTAPRFVGSATGLSMVQNTSALLNEFLLVRDLDGGQTLTWSQATAPKYGSLSFSFAEASSGKTSIPPGGEILYTPNTNFQGEDSFTVQISDGIETARRTITVTVSPPQPGAPTNIILSSSAVSAADIGPGGLLVGRLSASGAGSSFSYALVTGGGAAHNSSFELRGDGLYVRAPIPAGSYSVRLRATDNNTGGAFEKSFTIAVTENAAAILTADTTNNDVDHDIEITFASNTYFSSRITGVSFNGHALASAQFTVEDGKIILHPAVSAGNQYLRTAAAGNVVVHAAGHADSIVSQTIQAGAVQGLELAVQPSPGMETGALFSPQPAVRLKDQYGNLCANGPSASAAVKATALAGSGNWTLGGTATVAASRGLAGFTNLSCTSTASVTGRIKFSCGDKTVESSLFTTPGRSAVISPAAAAFDKFSESPAYKDISVTLTLNDNSLISVQNGYYALVNGSDYTLSGSALVLKKEYLASLGAGLTTLVFHFSQGLDRTLALTVSDTGFSNASVTLNGKTPELGSINTQTLYGQTTTTVKLDQAKMLRALETNGTKPKLVFQSASAADHFVVEFNGQTLRDMEQREATLELKTASSNYALTAELLRLDELNAQLGANFNLQSINIRLSIETPPASTLSRIEAEVRKNGQQLLGSPTSFEIRCSTGWKSLEISRFGDYVERSIAIPPGIGAGKLTTAVSVNADGSFSHAPTTAAPIGNRYYAKIRSLTNSTYAVIYNPRSFSDMDSHWAKDSVNNMGARLVVSGTDGGRYEPDRSITRAEFAAIMVRALGLGQSPGKSSFSDVSANDWFYNAVSTAADYKLITGRSNGRFAPADPITREEAMTILSRAMTLTKLGASLTDKEITTVLSKYTDNSAISAYARSGAASCIKAGIVNGKEGKLLAPKANVSRAEVAIMAERLLKQSKLI